MESMPHPNLPGYFLTTPLYVGSRDSVALMMRCDHQWPDELPAMTEDKGHRMGMQMCVKCGAQRCIYEEVLDRNPEQCGNV